MMADDSIKSKYKRMLAGDSIKYTKTWMVDDDSIKSKYMDGG